MSSTSHLSAPADDEAARRLCQEILAELHRDAARMSGSISVHLRSCPPCREILTAALPADLAGDPAVMERLRPFLIPHATPGTSASTARIYEGPLSAAERDIVQRSARRLVASPEQVPNVRRQPASLPRSSRSPRRELDLGRVGSPSPKEREAPVKPPPPRKKSPEKPSDPPAPPAGETPPQKT